MPIARNLRRARGSRPICVEDGDGQDEAGDEHTSHILIHGLLSAVAKNPRIHSRAVAKEMLAGGSMRERRQAPTEV